MRADYATSRPSDQEQCGSKFLTIIEDRQDSAEALRGLPLLYFCPGEGVGSLPVRRWRENGFFFNLPLNPSYRE